MRLEDELSFNTGTENNPGTIQEKNHECFENVNFRLSY